MTGSSSADLQVFELSESHEQKHLSGNADSTGSHTLNSTLSVSGGSHDDGGHLTSECVPQLQFQADKEIGTATSLEPAPADEDLMGLANRVGVGHTANWLMVRLVSQYYLCNAARVESSTALIGADVNRCFE